MNFDWLRTIGIFFGGLVAGIMRFAADHTYATLIVVLLIEEGGVPLPVPGDTIILYAGYRVAQGEINPLLAGLCIVLATLVGSSVLYWLARVGGHRLVYKYGKYVHLDEQKLKRMECWLHEHQFAAIVLGRLVPGLRTAVTVVAGIFEVRYSAFLLYTALSAVIWAAIYLSAGAYLGHEYEMLATYAVSLLGRPLVRGGLALAALVAGLWLLWRRRDHARAGKAGSAPRSAGS